MAKVWIVYRPVLNYEESIRNYLAFANEQDAQRAAQRINDFFADFCRRLERLPDPNEHGISNDEFSKRFDRHQDVINKAKWPFGISFEYDIGHIGNVVEVMEMRLIGARDA